MNSNDTYDTEVLIIGGGIAGAAAAIHLARQNCKVTIAEAAPLGTNKLSTHFLWPRGVSYLNRLGIDVATDLKAPVFEDVRFALNGKALKAAIPTRITATRLKQVHGHEAGATKSYSCVRRQVLDRKLIEKARSLGVTVHEEHKLIGLCSTMTSGELNKATLRDRQGKDVEITARVILAADGRNSTTAALTNNLKIDVSHAATTAIWTYFEGVPAQAVRLAKTGTRGFGAAATNDDKTMVLYWGSQAETSEILSLDEEGFRTAVAAIDPEFSVDLAQARRTEPFYRAANLESFRRKSTHQGVYFAGDAVCFKDQCTASGITHALCDAELVSESIASCLQGKISFEQARLVYTFRREHDRASYFAMACELAKMNEPTPEELLRHEFCMRDPGAASEFVATCGDSLFLDSHTTQMMNTNNQFYKIPEVFDESVYCISI